MAVRIDSHQHFWTIERNDYGWLTPGLTSLYRDYLPNDLQPLLNQAGIHRTILVQAAPTVAESRYLLRIADRHDFVAGVVGWVDMEAGPQTLADLQSLQENLSFVGVRPMIQDISDPAWMLRSSLQPMFRVVVELDLCFDALVKPAHLPFLLELLQRHPDLRLVVDHGAKPDIAVGAWQPWADGLKRIAEDTPAYCKVSGLITEASDTHSFRDLIPYMDHILDSFGAERVMWGSDWPVLNTRTDYIGWHSAARHWLSRLRAAHRDAIEGGNAARFYGLPART